MIRVVETARLALAGGVLATLVFVAGCASVPPGAGDREDGAAETRWRAHRQAIDTLGAFTASARVAVQATDRGASAKLRWRERDGRYSLVVEPPLGGGAFVLNELTGGRVELVTADGRTETSASPEALVARHLDLVLPVSGVRHWLKGVPDPNAELAYLSLTDEGLARDLEQSRWRVSVLEYIDVAGTPLPRRLFLSRDDVKVRIVVVRWNLST